MGTWTKVLPTLFEQLPTNQTVEKLRNAPDIIVPEIQQGLKTALSETAASSMAGFMESSMKETQEETQKKLLEQSRKCVQDAMEGELKALKEQEATARQTVETLKRATDDFKEFVSTQIETQKAGSAAPAAPSLDFPQIGIPTEEAPVASTSSTMVQESPVGPLTKKMRTSEVSCTKPVPDVEVKRTTPYLEELGIEVSKAMGIRPLTTNECTTGQILLLAARLINDDRELLIQAAKPRPKRPAVNQNVQEQERTKRYKGKKMQNEINLGFQELEKSVRRFSQERLKEKLPDTADPHYGVIQKAYLILNNQNINDPERSSVKKRSLRNAGESANLSEFYKNAKRVYGKLLDTHSM
ncbi:hypothetical protein [Endozoicomonas atrinae]|uniref:hypothetical protein n=1 Tax=Endozoicomonas atrinae TaxID=1333660 RepID=UPI003AFFA72B